MGGGLLACLPSSPGPGPPPSPVGGHSVEQEAATHRMDQRPPPGSSAGPGDSRPPWPSPPPSPALLSPILTPFLGPQVPEGNPQIRPRAKTRLGGQAPHAPWPVWGASARWRGSRGPSWSPLHGPPRHSPALTPTNSVAGLKMASPPRWAEEGGPQLSPFPFPAKGTSPVTWALALLQSRPPILKTPRGGGRGLESTKAQHPTSNWSSIAQVTPCCPAAVPTPSAPRVTQAPLYPKTGPPSLASVQHPLPSPPRPR